MAVKTDVKVNNIWLNRFTYIPRVMNCVLWNRIVRLYVLRSFQTSVAVFVILFSASFDLNSWRCSWLFLCVGHFKFEFNTSN
jgi:hypothetical protein